MPIAQSIGHIVACAALTIALPTADATQAAKSPVKVFILAGQSNMEGKGSIEHLKQLVADPEQNATYKHLIQPTGEWIVRDDVWIEFGGKRGSLTVGYARPEDRFGPELQLGHLLGNAFEEQVLLIKTAWGGRSLAVDFRPPSSGGETGSTYTEMLAHVRDVLANLEEYFPSYDGRGYEIAGFVWFQGWNDRINQEFNDAYEQNLANLIRDVRRELGIAKLPFVIGETGQGGVAETHPRALSLMAAQAAVAEHKEFGGNVRFVGTKAFYENEPHFDGGYHWFGNAKNFFNIGDAMGKALLSVLGKGNDEG